MPRPSLIVIGALHLDLVGRLQDAHRPAASNPVRFAASPGGVGANVARAIAAAGVPCDLVAPTGEGEPDPQLLTLPGVTVRPVATAGFAPGRYVAILDPDGELVAGFSDTLACEAASAERLLCALPPELPSGLVLDANLSADALAGIASAATVPIAALAVSPAKAWRLSPLASRIALLFCNRREAAELTGLPTASLLETLADGLAEREFSHAVLTDGAAGVLVIEPEARAFLDPPALPGPPNTVNGAGDALAGATLAAMAQGAELVAAVRDAGLPAASAVLRAR